MIARAALPLLLLVAGTAFAAGPRCNRDGSQAELNACATDELKAADAELNRVYREVLARNAKESVFLERMKAAQRLWVQLRDADLDAQFPLAKGQDPRLEYGSIYPMERAYAQAALTRERTRYLRSHWLDPKPGR